jgi:drug/metabolite transporter (DMT)-like permease
MKRVSTSSASATAAPSTALDPRLVASLAAVYVIWGSTYLAMRIAVADLPPFLMAAMRFIAAGAVLLAIGLRRGATWPSGRAWLRALPIGALLFVGGNGFVAIAEQSVSSGGAAVVCALMPLWVGVLGVFTGARPTRREWLALVTGFVGVVVLMGGPSLAGEPVHVALILLAPLSWAGGSILARRLPKPARPTAGDAFVTPALQMLTGGAALLVAGVLHREPLPIHAGRDAWLALGYLWVFGSLVAFTAYAWLLRNARPVVATSYAYVNPILAVLIGAVVSGESLGISTVVANVLIVGAVVAALSKPKPK